jgi:AcrR family transcriptional regulator
MASPRGNSSSAPAVATPLDEGPTTARGRRTREILVRAAREVFEKHGFLDARVADIADAAGVAHGTFYTYFESKETVFREVANALVGEMFAASGVGEDVPPDPVSRIEAANRRYLRAYAKNARILAILEQVATFNDYFRQLTRDIRKVFVDRAAKGITRLQAQGLADPTLDAATAASALGGMVEHFAHVWLALGEPFDEEVAVATLTRLWAQGIGLSMDGAPGRNGARTRTPAPARPKASPAAKRKRVTPSP